MIYSTMSDEMWANEFSSFVDKQLECANVRVKFPHAILCAPRDGLVPSPCSSRIDLRDTPCFTIDCSSTKDMDDAVSVEKTAIGYALGVHIADVAAYVKPGSSFDTCAMERGTSHYLPDRTIPMLPPVLSADLCSLNPCEDRLAVSVLVTLDANGAVVGYEVVKSTIRSRVKGVYDEVNAILEGVATPEVSSKYAAVIDQLPIMDEVSSLLLNRRVAAGAVVENGVDYHVEVAAGQVSLSPCYKRAAERIIEEFMVLANGLVADLFVVNHLPGIFRTQDRRGELAEYLDIASRHDSLALGRYVHFTSPIRRLSDLKVHQVLSAFLEGCTSEACHYCFDDVVAEASDVALRRARTAQSIAHACAKRCIARYFSLRPHVRFTGTVCGKDKFGNSLVLVDQTGTRVALTVPARIGCKVSFNVVVSGTRTTGVDARLLIPSAA